MKRHVGWHRRALLVGVFAWGWCSVSPIIALGADRMVIAEHFTNTG